ncbi:MAG: hypothetical protein U0837_00665 [Dehalococcoidia bacterium]
MEIGETANPTEWKTIGTGTAGVNEGPLGTIEPKDLKDNTVYTVRLSTDDGKGLEDDGYQHPEDRWDANDSGDANAHRHREPELPAGDRDAAPRGPATKFFS